MLGYVATLCPPRTVNSVLACAMCSSSITSILRGSDPADFLRSYSKLVVPINCIPAVS